MRVFLSGTISLAVMNRAKSCASTAKAMTNWMIWAMVRIGPLKCGMGSSSVK